MTFEDMLPTIISMIGGGVFSWITAFSGGFNRWLDRFTPEQKYLITMTLSGALGVVVTIAMSCAGLLTVLSCNSDIGPQLVLSAVGSATGNKTSYDAIRTARKSSLPTEGASGGG